MEDAAQRHFHQLLDHALTLAADPTGESISYADQQHQTLHSLPIGDSDWFLPRKRSQSPSCSHSQQSSDRHFIDGFTEAETLAVLNRTGLVFHV